MYENLFLFPQETAKLLGDYFEFKNLNSVSHMRVTNYSKWTVTLNLVFSDRSIVWRSKVNTVVFLIFLSNCHAISIHEGR
jgi:hypothetical protein